jgi:fructose-bisphosphate aldolase class II
LTEDEKYFKQHGEPLFSSHMIDLSEEEVDFNIQTTAKYLKRAAPMKQWLEMVIIANRSIELLSNSFIGDWYHWR